ncbi:hypothetical protein [Phenylobacterium sp. 58.2.17]|uniref:hypothetical protein n=1 Tax=Phenylobacterium sp. 58.2.17 TaxID=2969306 RepID=UPI00226541FD|nr:hypothetical protein [Phenylobacterium sp. 58.2.17]MCX7586572.1 hypothetical protein [Phenylobacterium sp. 58.2.17]
MSTSLNPIRNGKSAYHQILSLQRANCLTEDEFQRLFSMMGRGLELAVDLMEEPAAPAIVLTAHQTRPGGPFEVIEGGRA